MTKHLSLPAAAREPHRPRVSLTLTDTVLWLTRYDQSGCPEVTYPVSARAAANAFLGFEGLSTGILPENTLFVESGRVAIYLPPQTRTLSFGRHRALTVPMPGFVFSGAGSQYSIWAVTARPTTPNAELYHAPLPNVRPNGEVCQGNVKFPKCAPAAIHAAAQLFWESEFNGDLSEGKVRAQNRRGATVSLHNLLKSWSGRRRFPADQLVRFGSLASALKQPTGTDDAEPEDDWSLFV